MERMQSDIDAKGFRSLLEGSEVEYTGVRGDDDRLKAARVTGPGGTAVQACIA
jgi:cold shock CspA family protein